MLRPTHLHMYWIASWSPSQSLPLMVSYACHRQSSLDMLPSAALMPPWAATVWERVGNSLVRHLQGGHAVSMGNAADWAGVAWRCAQQAKQLLCHAGRINLCVVKMVVPASPA